MDIAVERLTAGYGLAEIIQGVSLSVESGQAVAIIGSNGAGKTTLLKAIVGLVEIKTGTVRFDGQAYPKMRTYRLARKGIRYVPAERELFPTMSVQENLEIGAGVGHGEALHILFERVFDLFPRLAERRRQLAGTMSGGEQQMLAVGRALMGNPRALMLDEPSTGLAPKAVADLYAQLDRLRTFGLTVIVAEQQVQLALQMASRAYVLEDGQITLEGEASALLGNPAIKQAYLGV